MAAEVHRAQQRYVSRHNVASYSIAAESARSRKTRVPQVGIHATLERLRHPRRSDGFDALYALRFDGAGGFDVRPLAEEVER
ncbi:hypothetical protein Airi02_091170 [Actinoallomurus iriomotensis]|uniref:Uncharacterized protein n=1 Tax=Actinoallomurus iriomotensis TaxID=478107 RepID=A0A9W6SCT9_9ACTN|nr:hypothetical protein Airi02_091170 [Actinoallomurus iriomotensis]